MAYSVNSLNCKEELVSLKAKYDEYVSEHLSLNMARGKPCTAQLDLSTGILEAGLLKNYKAEDGTEVRNYGVLDGIPECKRLFSEIMSVPAENIIIFGNSSLNIMYDYIAQCMISGAGDKPWCKCDKVKFLCPVPGYDRHFSILESFGIEMINIPMNPDGPDMNLVYEYIKDPRVKGLICVPMYSNPGGVTYSDEVVEKFAAMKPAASDFRVIWDNAYCVHHLCEDHDELLNVFEAAKKYNSEDMFIEVSSTSKITLPGAGVSALAASANNIAQIKKRMTCQTIGYDKVNQLRHASYFVNLDGIKAHMKKHAAIIAPKFDIVLRMFSENISDFASWTSPKGGYFISLDVKPGCAGRVVKLCKEAGVVLTGAGATYPYKKDPEDKNIRIAPTFPDTDELIKAVEILCVCVKIATLENN